MSTWAWYSSWLISSAVRSLPSCSAAIQDSAASSTSFLPIAWTPASSWATVPDPWGRSRAFSLSSAQSSSNVFTVDQPTVCLDPSCPRVQQRRPGVTWPTRATGRDGSRSALVAALDGAQGLAGGQGGGGRLVALVLLRPREAGAVERLLVVVAGEHAEPDGGLVVQRDPGQAVGGGVADVAEVRGPAADHDAEGDHRVVPLGGERGGDHRQLEGAGHPDHRGSLHLEVAAGAQGAVQQAVHDLLVPARGDHGDPQVVAVDGLLVGRSGSAHASAPFVSRVSADACARWGRSWPIRSRLVSR